MGLGVSQLAHYPIAPLASEQKKSRSDTSVLGGIRLFQSLVSKPLYCSVITYASRGS